MSPPSSIGNHTRRWGFSAALYALFCGALFWVQGPEPEITPDHLFYFTLVEPGINVPLTGSLSSLPQLGIYRALMRPLYLWADGDMVVMFKWFLATVAFFYLLATECFLGLFTGVATARLFSILSAFTVRLGASVWGFTDFSGSLHRNLVVPLFMACLWWYFAHVRNGRRYAVFPALICIALLHVGAFHLFAVLAVMEILRLLFVERTERAGQWIRFGLAVALSTLLLAIMFGPLLRDFGDAGDSSGRSDVSSTEAWSAEKFLRPYNVMPLPIGTAALIALSYSFILAITVGGWIGARRSGWNLCDKVMTCLFAAVPLFAYLPGTVLWGLRSFTDVYPVTLEETRALMFILVPSIYFALRLWQNADRFVSGVWAQRGLRAALCALFLAQPLWLVQRLPLPARRSLLDLAVEKGVVSPDVPHRWEFANSLLLIDTGKYRTYYSFLGVLDWLRHHADPSDVILTDRDDIRLFTSNAVGPFNSYLGLVANSPEMKRWRELNGQVSTVLEERDWAGVERLAERNDARFAIVPWTQPGAVYSDRYFSVVPIGDGDTR